MVKYFVLKQPTKTFI